MIRKKSHGEALLLDTDFIGEMKDIDICDGKVVIDDKEFFVEGVKPIAIKKRRGFKPFFIFKWDVLTPAKFIKKEERISSASILSKFKLKKGKVLENSDYIFKRLVNLSPEFDDKKYKVTPQLLKDTADMRFLKNMKKYTEEGVKKKMGLNPIIMTFVFAIGMLAMYMLLSSGMVT